ncbi:MAG: hypothetical protein CMP22_03085 [Rickettsiales bacterium]|nr:hypothetical protein [Rickettsiales bacterium]|tara:strand:+ start:4195 stop:5922 length:1728 start_codon:yes stop_codon:yes gene_type:complete
MYVSNDIVTLPNQAANAASKNVSDKSRQNDYGANRDEPAVREKNDTRADRSENAKAKDSNPETNKANAQNNDKQNSVNNNDIKTDQDFAAFLLNSIEPGSNSNLFDANKNKVNQDQNFSLFGNISHIQTQEQINSGKPELSADTLNSLQAIISDLTQEGLIPENFDADQFIETLENEQFDVIQSPENFNLVNQDEGPVGLETALLFENPDGTVEAAFLVDGKVHTAPLSDILETSSGLSIEKVLSAHQAVQNILTQNGYSNPSDDVAVHVQTISSALEKAQNALGSEFSLNFEDGLIAPDYEWRSSAKSSLFGKTVANAMQNNNGAFANAIVASSVGSQLILPNAQNNNAAQSSQNLIGIGSIDWSQVLNADLDGGNFNGSDFQGGDFIENSLDPDQLIQKGANAKDQSFANLVNNAKASGAPVTRQAPVAEQVMMNIQKGAEGKMDKITLQLDPHEMGKLEIQFDFSEDGKTKALILAEKPETLNHLKQDMKTIETLLADAGLDLGGNGLEFDLKNGGFEQNTQDQQRKFYVDGNSEFNVMAGDDVTMNEWNSQNNIINSSEGIISATKVNILV